MEYQIAVMQEAVDAQGQKLVKHLRMWNEETKVHTCQTYSQKKLRNAEFAKEWPLATLTE